MKRYKHYPCRSGEFRIHPNEEKWTGIQRCNMCGEMLYHRSSFDKSLVAAKEEVSKERLEKKLLAEKQANLQAGIDRQGKWFQEEQARLAEKWKAIWAEEERAKAAADQAKAAEDQAKAAKEDFTKIRPVVMAFALQMEMKLRKHDADRGPDGWRHGSTFTHLWYRMMEEAAEMMVARHSSPFPTLAVTKECADVANMAMMIADVYGDLGYYEGKDGIK